MEIIKYSVILTSCFLGMVYASYYSPRHIMVDTTNQFGICVLQVVASRDENVAFSPYGLVSVALVLYEGSRGTTAAEIHNTLRLPWDREVTRVGFRDMHRYLKSYFSNDGFLRGLVLSKPNVIINRNYSELLQFYGFDVSTGISTDMPTTALPGMTTVITTKAPMVRGETLTTNGTQEPSTTVKPETTTAKVETTSAETPKEEPPKETPKQEPPKEAPTEEPPKEETTVKMETSTSKDVPTPNPSINTIVNTVMLTDKKPDMPEIMAQINLTDLTTMPTLPESKEVQMEMGLETTASAGKEPTSESASTNIEVTSTPNLVTAAMEISVAKTTMSKTVTTYNPNTTPMIESTVSDMDKSETNMMEVPLVTPAALESRENEVTNATIAVTTGVPPTEASTVAFSETSAATTPQTEVPAPTVQAETSAETNAPTTEGVRAETSAETNAPTTEGVRAETSAETNAPTTEAQATSTPATNVVTSSAESDTATSQETTDPPSTETARKKRSYDTSHLVAEHRDGISNWMPIYQDPRFNYQSQNELWFFTFSGGETVPVLTYTAYLPFAYISQLNALALQLPLDDPRYSIVILLPEQRDGLSQLLYEMQWCPIRSIMSHLKATAVYAVVPSFTVVKHVNLGPAMLQLGIRSLFDPFKSDLSTMSPEPHVFVRTIEQVVTVSLRKYYANHRWFDATPSDVQQHFIANHPFAYFVLDKETDVALMIGTIVNPIAHNQNI